MGQRYGIDGIIIGNTAGSLVRIVEKESYWRKQQYFIEHSKLNLRVINAATGQVEQSRTFSGNDCMKTPDQLKLGNIVFTGLLGAGSAVTVILLFLAMWC